MSRELPCCTVFIINCLCSKEFPLDKLIKHRNVLAEVVTPYHCIGRYLCKDYERNSPDEELIKYGFPEDIWFHTDNLSSAHVYLRLQKGQTIDDIPPALLQDCAQLVKANSIIGNKKNNVDVVYTEWKNLKKTASMDVGQVSFHNSKTVKVIKVEKRINDIINRLNKTKVERFPCLMSEREERDRQERAEQKELLRKEKEKEKVVAAQKEEEAKLRSYTGLMSGNMTSNQDEAEDSDEFM